MKIELPDYDEAIKSFVTRYLNPKAELVDPVGAYDRMVERAAALDWPLVADLICRQDEYSYYRHCIYWTLLAQRVKDRDRRICQNPGCGYQGRHLEVHHLTYDHYGSEHLHLRDLTTLCARCHDLVHADVLAALVHENELKVWDGVEKMTEALEDIYVPRADDEEIAKLHARNAAKHSERGGRYDESENERERERRRGSENRPGDSR